MPKFGVVLILCGIILLTGCGGGAGVNSSNSSSAAVTSVTVSCSPVTVGFAGTTQCSPTVNGTGSFSSAVTWSATAGTIDQSGLFTAPKTANSATITATSKQDSSKSGTATLTLTTISGVTVSCISTSIENNATNKCSANVTGTGNFDESVTWSASSGSIDANGNLTAPATGTSTTITAGSKMDPSRTGSATIALTAPTTYSAQSGVAQKGPLILGSQVTIQELDHSLNPTGKQYTFQTTSDLGTFSPSAKFSSKILSATASGYYFDENQNAISTGPITLESYSDLTSENVINVNLLTTLAYQREQVLVQSGNSLDVARENAEKEVLAAFHIRNAGQYPNFGQLDLGKSGPANVILATLSSVFDYGQNAGNLAALIANFQSDIADNGVIDTPSTLATIAASSAALDPSAVAANLNAKYSSVSLNLTPADIKSWLDRDGDGVVGKFKYYQLNATANTTYTSQPYIAGLGDDGTTFAVSAGTLFNNGTAVPSGGGVVHAGDSLTIQLTASPNPGASTAAYMLSDGVRVARFKITTSSMSIGLGGSIGIGGNPNSAYVTSDTAALLIASWDTCYSTCPSSISNGGLYAYSLSTPTAPLQIGHTYYSTDNPADFPPGVAPAYYAGVAYSAATKTAFTAAARGVDGELQAFGASNPSSPTLLSEVPVAGNPIALSLSPDQNSAYYLGSQGLSQFDVSAPAVMAQTSTIAGHNFLGVSTPLSMAVSPDGKQLLVFAESGGVWEVDLSSGTLGAITELTQNPIMKSAPNYTDPNGANGFRSGTYVGNRTVVLLGTTGATLVDLTDPANPVIKGAVTFASPDPHGAAFYSVARGLVYLVTGNNFYVLNPSDPASPYIEGTAALPIPSNNSGGPSAISASGDGNTAYVVNAGQATVVTIP